MKCMKIRELISEYEYKFKDVSQSPRLDAELLLRRALKDVDRIYLLMNLDKEVSENEFKEFEKMALQRLKHRPIAYILGVREFMGLDFEVREGVLIPRPDTEILVERAFKSIDDLQENLSNGEVKSSPVNSISDSIEKEIGFSIVAKINSIKVLDIGTGSGAIAISLKYYRPKISVDAVDLSDDALEVSMNNSKKILGDGKINLIKSDLFKNVHDKYDIIVSNPPYIEKKDMKEMDAQVLDYEPHSALFAEDEGLFFYKKIIVEAKKYLNDNGRLIFECGHDQAYKIKDIFISEGYVDIEITKDLAGINRVVEARRIESCKLAK